MPTRWRNLRRLVAGSLTVSPSKTIRPPWIGSKPLIQRSIVLLPEPERPMMAMISPGCTVSETRSSTVLVPNRLTTSRSSTRDTKRPFQAPAPLRQRKAHGEIDCSDDDVDSEGAIGRRIRELALARQLDETDHSGQRSILDELDEEANGRWNSDPHGLRNDDVAQLVSEAEPERRAGFPLLARDRLQAAAPDVAEKCSSVYREGDHRRDPR